MDRCDPLGLFFMLKMCELGSDEFRRLVVGSQDNETKKSPQNADEQF